MGLLSNSIIATRDGSFSILQAKRNFYVLAQYHWFVPMLFLLRAEFGPDDLNFVVLQISRRLRDFVFPRSLGLTLLLRHEVGVFRFY